MTLEQLGIVLGAAVASAGTVVVGARKWLSGRSETKLDALAVEVGVGTLGPSLVSLVASTASAVERLEHGTMRNGDGIAEILRVQETHGIRLNKMDERHATAEAAHKVLVGEVLDLHGQLTRHDNLERAYQNEIRVKLV